MAHEGTNTPTVKESMEASEVAANILAQGKCNMVCGEIPMAVNQFQEACQLLSKAYGETAKECADAYFCYGQSLLELARMENGILGNALQGVPEIDDADDAPDEKDDQFEKVELEDQEREKLRFEVYDAMAEKDAEESEQDNEKKSEEPAITDEVDGDSSQKINIKVDGETDVKDKSDQTPENSGDEDGETDVDKKVEIKSVECDKKLEKDTEAGNGDVKDVEMTDAEKNDEEGNVTDGGENAKEVEGTEETDEVEEEADVGEETTSHDESQDEENPDDISNLQLAWEMLELAKIIYLKNECKESQLRAAESHLKLGEVSIETEQYEVAVKDLNQCLEIQKTHLELDNRQLAETYYQLGLAYCFNKQFTESTNSYTSAIKVIEERIKNLDKILAEATEEEKDAMNSDSTIFKAKKEVDELKKLMPDIMAKLEDVEDEKKNLDKLINLAKETMCGSSSTSAVVEVVQSEVQADDISHLIKRKRKSENTLEDEVPKRVKHDGNDGEAADNGHIEKRKSDDDITPEDTTKKARLDIGDGDVMDVEFSVRSKSEDDAEESAKQVYFEEGDGDAMDVELTTKENLEDVAVEFKMNEGIENIAENAIEEKCDSKDTTEDTKDADENTKDAVKDTKDADDTEIIAEDINTKVDAIDEKKLVVESKLEESSADIAIKDKEEFGDGNTKENKPPEMNKCEVATADVRQNMGDGDTNVDNGLAEKPVVAAMETQS